MEDWVERLHQWGMQQRRQFRTVQNPLVRANASCIRTNDPEVLAQMDAMNQGNSGKCQKPMLKSYRPNEKGSVRKGGQEQ
jgi:hypothetical protein